LTNFGVRRSCRRFRDRCVASNEPFQLRLSLSETCRESPIVCSSCSPPPAHTAKPVYIFTYPPAPFAPDALSAYLTRPSGKATLNGIYSCCSVQLGYKRILYRSNGHQVWTLNPRGYPRPPSGQGSHKRIDRVVAGRLCRFPSKFWPRCCQGQQRVPVSLNEGRADEHIETTFVRAKLAE
jgi:hypothetical protein